MSNAELKCGDCGKRLLLSDKPAHWKGGPGKTLLCEDYPVCRGLMSCDKGGRPLGVPANQQVRTLRRRIHDIHLDPLWKSGKHRRAKIYLFLSDKLGKQYHTANIATIEEGEQVIEWLKEFVKVRAAKDLEHAPKIERK